MRARVLAALAVFGIAACQIVLVGDLEVRGTLDDSCATYGVAQWDVTAEGPERHNVTVLCSGTSFTTGVRLYAIAEGTYTVTVKALDSSGKILAQKSDSGPVLSDVGHVSIVTLAFKASDFNTTPTDCGNGICEDTKGETCTNCAKDCGSCPPLDCGNGICEDTKGETCTSCAKDCGSCPSQGKLNVYWNINGTLDGSAKADSWDTCAEVGAVYAAVDVDGTKQYLPCNQNNMTGSVNVSEGSHTVSVALTDGSKNAITTATAAKTVTGCTAAAACEIVVDFFWDSFLTLKNTMKGDFLFTTSFDGGKSCSQVTPQVTTQASLLYLSGSAVNPAPEVCGPNSVCYKMDGAATGECWGPNQTQKIKNYAWGEYQIAIRGIINGGNICYDAVDKAGSKKVDIVIGAGTVNPTVDFDLKRDTVSPLCQ